MSPNRTKTTTPALLASLLLVAAVAGLVACSEPPAESKTLDPPPAVSPPPDPDLVRLDPEGAREVGIVVSAAEQASVPEEIRVAGRVTNNENVTARVGSFSEGVVVECCLSVGTFVKKGQVLTRLHSHDVHEAEAQYWQARSKVERARAELEYAELAYKRASRLHELKAGSQQAVQEAETALRRAETALDFEKAALERANDHLRYLGFDPSKLPEPSEAHSQAGEDPHDSTHLITVKSPISGTIIERPASQGAVVTPSDPLYVISDLSRLWVIAQVPEEHLAFVRKGMKVDVLVRAYPGRTFPGRVDQISDALDPETRTVQVRCDVNNHRAQLKREMYATLVMRAGGGKPAVVVPISAVQHLDGEAVVFLEAGENQFRVRRITTGRQLASRVEVVSGLQVGERVVIHGSFPLKSELLKGQMVEEH